MNDDRSQTQISAGRCGNPKVFGIGLNKTGTKTLAKHLKALGFRHRSYDSPNVTESPSFDLWEAKEIDALLSIMDNFDSCEDWPWPLLYRELDERFVDSKFVLTIRRSADAWYQSLCKMAVRIGPLPLYEKSVYGSSMPHGRKQALVQIYNRHNAAVEAYFADRPGKLLKLCWETNNDPKQLTDFLGAGHIELASAHVNRSPGRVYAGDSLPVAHMVRIFYQSVSGPRAPVRRVLSRAKRYFGSK